jgi:hypothetical protein
MHDTDGRLDLDDLGEVIDHASSLQPLEILGEERSAPTWGERLEAAGVTGWVRRHRAALAVATAATLVLGTGVTAVATHRDPPVDPIVHASVLEIPPTSSVQNGDYFGGITWDGSVRRSAYRVVLDPALEAGSSIRVLGLVGPGIRATDATAQPADPSSVSPGIDVDVIVDCALAPAEAAVHAYSLVVQRTDSWGRAVTASLPTPDVNADWPREVRQSCFQERAWTGITLTSLAVHSYPSRDQVDLDLAFSSAFDAEVLIGVEETSSTATVGVPRVEGTAPAHGGTSFPVSLKVRDCRTPALEGASSPVLSDDPQVMEWKQYPGLYLFVRSALDDVGATAVARFTPQQDAEVTAALERVCVGAPPMTATVVRATPLLLRTVPTGEVGSVTTALTLDVATTGQHVTVGDVDPTSIMFNGIPSRIDEADGDVRSGHVRLSTVWAVDCSQGLVEPVPIRIDVRTPEGLFPYVEVLRDAQLKRSILSACPSIDEQSMHDAGWDLS